MVGVWYSVVSVLSTSLYLPMPCLFKQYSQDCWPTALRGFLWFSRLGTPASLFHFLSFPHWSWLDNNISPYSVKKYVKGERQNSDVTRLKCLEKRTPFCLPSMLFSFAPGITELAKELFPFYLVPPLIPNVLSSQFFQKRNLCLCWKHLSTTLFISLHTLLNVPKENLTKSWVPWAAAHLDFCLVLCYVTLIPIHSQLCLLYIYGRSIWNLHVPVTLEQS